MLSPLEQETFILVILHSTVTPSNNLKVASSINLKFPKNGF